MKAKATQEWIKIFEAAKLPYSPINNIRQICEDPYIQYRRMLVEVDQPGIGKMKMVGSPVSPAKRSNPGPRRQKAQSQTTLKTATVYKGGKKELEFRRRLIAVPVSLKCESGLSHHSQPAFCKEEDEKVFVANPDL
jgi:crotonobetainyl-CoA:carnitine CoA-transferase CaiB-like acyl-CoA transferase